MSKNENPDSSTNEAQVPRKRRWLRVLMLDVGICLALAAIVVGTWHLLSPRSSPINYFLTADALPAVPRVPRPETLDPALFTGRVRESYRVARERPALLERLPCYCGCYLTHGHQNSLDCFHDRHAETCLLCLDIALQAEQLAKRGYDVADIKAILDRQYARRKKSD